MKLPIVICLIVVVSGLYPAFSEPRVTNQVILRQLVSEHVRFNVVQVVENLEHPWAIKFLPDGRGLITERSGRLWIKDGNRLYQVTGLPEVRAGGQGGLLDVIAHPDFENNHSIYLSYSAEYGEGVGTRVARAVLKERELHDVSVIFEMSPPGSGPVHFGSRFAFDRDGYLYVTFGERGDRHLSQRLDTHHGKVIRIRDDGSVPEDNPFAGRDQAHPEIYTYGHRNPQGIIYDANTGLIWTHEHGPRGGDTVNILRAGRNYGWPLATHGREYHGPRIGTIPENLEHVENPIIHWTPSIAPCGFVLVRNSQFPEWEGNMLAGALVQQHIRRLVVEGEQIIHQEILLKDMVGRIRDINVSPDGHIWFVTDARDGGLYRLDRAVAP
ncbi:MAG TPA: PQQ-dependent sugar dehydrogenase [Kiritimatiellia bacterium]|nr:PQQ-dependent sugar dehydrogenase [Kiritimatiellia bacterium]